MIDFEKIPSPCFVLDENALRRNLAVIDRVRAESGAGVFNVEQFNPDPFLAELGEQGLPWIEEFDIDLEV